MKVVLAAEGTYPHQFQANYWARADATASAGCAGR